VRCWIHPRLKNTLEKIHEMLNKESIKQTNYPIPSGLPISSEIASKILEKIVNNNKNLISVKPLDGKTIYNANISVELKNPVVFLISSNWNMITQEDKDYLNLQLQKIKGIKKNEITFGK